MLEVVKMLQTLKDSIKKAIKTIGIIWFRIFKVLFNKKTINNRMLIEEYYKDRLVIKINPSKISYYLPVGREINGNYTKRCKGKFVCNGNWENDIEEIEGHRKTQDMYELFDTLGKYENTYAYQRHISELENGNLNTKNEPKNEVLNTYEKIENYYLQNIKLYNTIKNKGFFYQTELGNHPSKEVGVAIGRDGELYRFGNGYHRMAIAKYLKLYKIPMIIKLIHKDWFEYCRNKHDCDPIEAIKIEVLKIYSD